MTKSDIIAELYRSHFVEVDARRFMGCADRQWADDIVAELYAMICELPERLVVEIYDGCGAECFRRYVAGLIIRQLRSTNSKIYRKYTSHVYRTTTGNNYGEEEGAV